MNDFTPNTYRDTDFLLVHETFTLQSKEKASKYLYLASELIGYLVLAGAFIWVVGRVYNAIRNKRSE